MIQSFLVYIFFGLILFLLGRLSQIRENDYKLRNKKVPFWTWDVWLALFVFSFVSGVRWNVGVDYMAYLNNYISVQRTGDSLFNKEMGFEFITNIFANSNIHFSFYFGFIAFLQMFFIYNAFKDQRYLYPFLSIVIIFGPEYLNWMNGMRQMLAATMFVFSIQFIVKRQFIKYFITIFLASLIHTSALMLIVFYFISQKDYFRNRVFTFSLFFLTIYLGANNSWRGILNNLGGLLELLDYDSISERLILLIEDDQIRSFGPRRIGLIIITIITVFYQKKMKLYFEKTYFLIYFNLMIIGFLLFNLLSGTHHIFIRPLVYLIIFSIPTTVYLLVYLSHNLRSQFHVFVLVLTLSLSYLPLSIIADVKKGDSDHTNYKFFWYHINK